MAELLSIEVDITKTNPLFGRALEKLKEYFQIDRIIGIKIEYHLTGGFDLLKVIATFAEGLKWELQASTTKENICYFPEVFDSWKELLSVFVSNAIGKKHG